jgi:hypothetical protein
MDFSEIGWGRWRDVDLVLGCHEVLGESSPRKRLNPFMIMNEWCRAAHRNIFVFERGTGEARHSLT